MQVAECQLFCAQRSWCSGTVLTAGNGRTVTDFSPIPGFLTLYRTSLVHVRQKAEAGAASEGRRGLLPELQGLVTPYASSAKLMDSFHSWSLGEKVNPVLSPEVRDNVLSGAKG